MAETKATTTTKKQGAENTSRFLHQETQTIEGVEYTFQFPGTRRTQEILDESKNIAGVVVDAKYNELLMAEVIVSPQTDWDYWDKTKGYREVMQAADIFLGNQL